MEIESLCDTVANISNLEKIPNKTSTLWFPLIDCPSTYPLV